MNAVELIVIEDSLILRARGSELLILSPHIVELKKTTKPAEFVAYFLHEALVNRSARKLLEAWLRKDQTLWKRVHQKVQEMAVSEKSEKLPKTESASVKAPVAPARKVEETKVKVAKPAKIEVESVEVKKPKVTAKIAEPNVEDKKPTAKKPTVKKKETEEKATKKEPASKKPAASTSKSVAAKKK